MTSDHTDQQPTPDADQARLALDEVHRRRQQTIAAGTAPWPWPAMLAAAATFVAFGICIDADMVWLGAVLIGVGAATTVPRAVRLRADRARDRGTDAAIAAVFGLAIVVDVAVQFAVRAADVGIPNTLGCAAAAAVVLAAVPVIQQRAATRPQAR